jgi:predicted CXXCH cytochrome family protein
VADEGIASPLDRHARITDGTTILYEHSSNRAAHSTGIARLIGLGILTLLAASALPTLAQSTSPPEELDPTAPCVSGGCHAEFRDYSHLHWKNLYAPGECGKCHESETGEHDFSLDDSADGCFTCHDDLAARADGDDNLHSPFEDGCFDCHDPHGGAVEELLIDTDGVDLRELCFQCHDSDILDVEHAHGPADQGACNTCHDPHSSRFGSLLLGEGLDLCGQCHEAMAQEIRSAAYVHDPVDGGCTDCHGPHGGSHPMLLSAAKGQLCSECHDDVVEHATTAAVDHAPVVSGEECLSCHSAHASSHAANLKLEQRDLCLGCHDRPVQSGDTVLADMKSWLRENENWHQPIRDGECAVCHQPHGAENERLLAASFPPNFYSDFSVDEYDLCFSCHEKALVTKELTRSLTGFRNGNRNLHFVHVNKARRGRTCRACHDMHASPNPMQIRDEAPFGKWSMPINYEPTENGGSCHPGCHKIEPYDRKAENFEKE